MADETDAAIMITDVHARVAYHNSGFTKMFGWTLDETHRKPVSSLLVRQASEGFFDDIHREFVVGRSVKVDELILNKFGHRHWCNVICSPVMGLDGEWKYTLSVLLDITRTKIYEVLNNSVLEAVARDLPLIEVLEMVCEKVEQIAPEISASILQVDE